MKTIHTLPALLLAFLLAWPLAVQGQVCSVDSTTGAQGATVSDSGGNGARLCISVRDADTGYVAVATLTARDPKGNRIPIANATVSFFVKRLFGKMPIAEENTAPTNDSGVAELPFSKNIPLESTGSLTIIALIEDNAYTGPLQATMRGNWGRAVPVVADPFPRALWEPRAPIAMILTFCILLGGVWCTYIFVVNQVVQIKKGKHNEA